MPRASSRSWARRRRKDRCCTSAPRARTRLPQSRRWSHWSNGISSPRPMLRLAGTPASPGLARGPVFRLQQVERTARRVESAEAERDAIAAAMTEAQRALAALADETADEEAAGILAFQ